MMTSTLKSTKRARRNHLLSPAPAPDQAHAARWELNRFEADDVSWSPLRPHSSTVVGVSFVRNPTTGE
jgi:hypothetical protein